MPDIEKWPSQHTTKVLRWQKKPVVVDCMLFTGHNQSEITDWVNTHETAIRAFSDHLIIPTLEGDHRADIGDVIIKGVEGEFYPCKPGIFWKTYEEVI